MPKGQSTKDLNWTKISERLLSLTSNGKVQNQKAVLKLLEKIQQNSRTISSNDLRVSRIGKTVNDIRRNNRELVQVNKLAKQIVSNFQKLATSEASQSSQPCTPVPNRNSVKTPSSLRRNIQTPNNGASPALSRLAQKTPVASNAVQRTPIPKKPQPKNQILNNHVQSKFSKVSTLNLNQNEIQTSARKAGRKRAAPSNSTPTAINSKRARPSSPPAQKVSPKVEEEEPKKCLPTLRIKLKKDSKANYKVQENGTKPSHGSQTNGYQQQQATPSPPDFDSLDSDRTPRNGTSIERVSPTSRDSWTNQNASSLVSSGNQPKSSPKQAASNEVYFDVQSDPYFCSTIATEPPSDTPEEERHGLNGCYGDNGKFYEWKDTILLKHKYKTSIGEPINDNLLVIMPYCDID